MRLLDRYLLRECAVPFFYCLTGFLIFWVSFDLVSQLGDFQENLLGPSAIAKFYLFSLPEFLVEILPIALLLALLYALGNHARHHEIIAMRAAGVAFWRISLPYLCLGLALSALVFVLNEIWAPRSAGQAEAILNPDLSPNHPEKQWKRNLAFVNSRDQRDWNIARYNLQTYEMENPQITSVLPNGGIRQIFAERGVWTNGMWVFYNVSQFFRHPKQNLPEERMITNYLAAPEFTETPDLLKSEIKMSRLNTMRRRGQVSIQQILEYRYWHPSLSKRERAFYNSQLHARLAMPWTCLVVVLIALPFGAVSTRRSVFVGVASSIVLCFSYFVLSRVTLALGYGGYIPGWVGAWLPNLLFGLGGIGFVNRLQ